ncbi:MAG: D-amino acid aminotransferase [Proteobacteria bacterium]|nr:D-amino acid aminotransferase [Burkholderiales bacterium]
MVHLNGEFMPIEEAKISPLDRGFIFGDGVYEVIPVYGKRPFRMIEHLQRMQRSMDKIGLANPHSIERWEALCNELIERTPHPDQGVYIQVTRGVAPRDHAFPKNVTPTVFMMSNPMRKPPPEWHTDGAAAITANDDRWFNNDIKSTALLGNVLARQKSAEVGAVETILLRDGMLTEASSSNVLIVADGVIASPPKSNLLLPGTTFDVTIELARKHGMAHELRAITEAQLRAADEIWVTSATKEVLPITLLDGKPVGTGRPGPVWKTIHAHYQAFKHEVTGCAIGPT